MGSSRGLYAAMPAVLMVLALLSVPASAAEKDIGAQSRLGGPFADHVPGLRVGTTAPGFELDEGSLVTTLERRRCEASLDVNAVLVARRLPAYPGGRNLSRRTVPIRGWGALRMHTTRYDTSGSSPAVALLLEGVLPRAVAPFEPRRRLAVTVVSSGGGAGCLGPSAAM